MSEDLGKQVELQSQLNKLLQDRINLQQKLNEACGKQCAQGDAMNKAAKDELKGILEINTKPLVSKDFNHNPHSSIFDATQTQVVKGKFSRVLSWYDNEWGFSNRMCDTAIQIASLI